MRNAETFIPFLVAIIALLGYAVWLLRKLSASIGWFRRLPREHEWLMDQVKANTSAIKDNGEEIKRIMQVIEALVTKQ
jgi:hypothetical protein